MLSNKKYNMMKDKSFDVHYFLNSLFIVTLIKNILKIMMK